MTHSPGDERASEAMQALHVLLEEDELLYADETADSEDVVDSKVLDIISTSGLEMMSPDARDLLLRLTDYSENLEPATRQRLVQAAERGLQWRRENAGSLPVLLFARRRASALSATALSERIGIDPQVMAAVESGRAALPTVGASAAATWIHALDVEFDVAEAALRRSSQRRQAPRRVAGVERGNGSDDDEEFVAEVLSKLRELKRG